MHRAFLAPSVLRTSVRRGQVPTRPAYGRPCGHNRLLACLLALPLVVVMSSSGCTDQACIQWSEEEGPCPPRSEAIKFMIPATNCNSGGKVVSVDSEGDFDGQACCYDVTNRDENEEIVCDGVSGVGVTTGASAVTSTGVGAAGGGPPQCSGETCSADCFAPEPAPSNGSCVAMDNITVFCNPISNAGCFEGGTCDFFFDGFSTVLSCSSNFFTSTCSPCFTAGECQPGNACLSQCTKFCCDDNDCSIEGRCAHQQTTSLGFPQIGVCVLDTGTGGSGGAGVGGAGGAGGQGGI